MAVEPEAAEEDLGRQKLLAEEDDADGGPVLGMAEAMSNWGGAKAMEFARGDMD